jgi:cytochrome c553
MSGLRVRRSVVFTLLFALAAALVACGSNDSLQIMGAQPRYNPLTQSTQFADGMASRPPVSDTVSLGDLRDDSLLFTGQSGGQPSVSFPFTITREVLLRGQDRFNVFCAPCHSRTGDGNGMIVQRGFPRAASLLSDRLRSAPAGYLFGMIGNGFGAMPAYAAQVPAPDRWAIVAYIRALQLSRHATLDDVPADQRDKLGTDAGP